MGRTPRKPPSRFVRGWEGGSVCVCVCVCLDLSVYTHTSGYTHFYVHHRSIHKAPRQVLDTYLYIHISLDTHTHTHPHPQIHTLALSSSPQALLPLAHAQPVLWPSPHALLPIALPGAQMWAILTQPGHH
jgi:hypothetical protein